MSNTTQQFRITTQKLDVKPGDTLLMYLPSDFSFEYTKELAAELRNEIPENTTILLLKEGVSVETLPEEIMNNMGWYRLDVQNSVEVEGE